MSTNSNATQPRRLHKSALTSTIDRGNDGTALGRPNEFPGDQPGDDPIDMYVHKYDMYVHEY